MPSAKIKAARRQKSEWFLTSSLPKVNQAKLTMENRVYIHPVAHVDKDKFVAHREWKVVGWNNAPSAGCGPHAIVYECLRARDTDYYEVGKIYWGHGNADKMNFCTTLTGQLQQEYEPWL